MDHVEPITCSACGRLYAPKFPACIYCKYPRPDAAKGPPKGEARAPRDAGGALPSPPMQVSTGTPTHAVVMDPPSDDDEPVSIVLWAIRGGILVLALLGATYAIATLRDRWARQHADLVVSNTTGSPGLSVVVDGNVVLVNLPSTPTESPLSSGAITLDVGSHAVEARDSTGALLDAVRVDVMEGSFGFLFAPKHAADACFTVDTLEYSSAGDEVVEPLNPRRELWEMTKHVDQWFRPNSPTAPIRAGIAAKRSRAVRMVPCELLQARLARRAAAEEVTVPIAADAGTDAAEIPAQP